MSRKRRFSLCNAIVPRFIKALVHEVGSPGWGASIQGLVASRSIFVRVTSIHSDFLEVCIASQRERPRGICVVLTCYSLICCSRALTGSFRFMSSVVALQSKALICGRQLPDSIRVAVEYTCLSSCASVESKLFASGCRIPRTTRVRCDLLGISKLSTEANSTVAQA